MKIICHEQEQKKAEIISEELIFQGADEAVMLVGDLLPSLIYLLEWREKFCKNFRTLELSWQ